MKKKSIIISVTVAVAVSISLLFASLVIGRQESFERNVEALSKVEGISNQLCSKTGTPGGYPMDRCRKKGCDGVISNYALDSVAYCPE